MRSVLMLAFLFPPRASIGAKRPFRFARHLPSHGWRPVVLAGPPGTPRENDPSLMAAMPSDLVVDRSWAPEGFWALRNWGQAWSDRRRGKPRVPSAPVSSPPKKSWLPTDGNIFFFPWTLDAATSLVERYRPSVIYVTGYPMSAHLVGLALKRRTGLPLVCELRDPWTLNFEFHRHDLTAAIERRWERRVFEGADRVVVTTRALRDAYAAHFPQLPPERIRCIYSPFDEGLAPADPRPAGQGAFTIVHFGHFYGPRRAASFLRALAAFRDRRRLAAGALRYIVLGRIDAPEDHALIAELGLSELVEIRKPVPYVEGLALLRRADLLHLPSYGDETFYIPGKLYDYLLAGRPILCETKSDELADIVKRTGTGQVVTFGDVPALTATLERALVARDGGAAFCTPDAGEVARFSAPHLSGELASLFDEVSGTSARPTTAWPSTGFAATTPHPPR